MALQREKRYLPKLALSTTSLLSDMKTYTQEKENKNKTDTKKTWQWLETGKTGMFVSVAKITL